MNGRPIITCKEAEEINQEHNAKLIKELNEEGNKAYLDSSTVLHNGKKLNEILDRKDVYSTAETKIGTWVDNKPIYRKCINFNFSSTADRVFVSHNISNLDIVIRLYGFYASGDQHRFLPQIYTESAYDFTITPYVVTNATIEIDYGSWIKQRVSSVSNAYVIIEYTKTTD